MFYNVYLFQIDINYFLNLSFLKILNLVYFLQFFVNGIN